MEDEESLTVPTFLFWVRLEGQEKGSFVSQGLELDLGSGESLVRIHEVLPTGTGPIWGAQATFGGH